MNSQRAASTPHRKLLAPWYLSLAFLAQIGLANDCPAPAEMIVPDGSFAHTAQARVQHGKVKIVFIASGVAAKPALDRTGSQYPERFRYWLGRAWTPKSIEMFTLDERNRTAEEIAEQIPAIIGRYRPSLLIWEVGHVDAVEGVDLSVFGDALERGITAANAADVDVLLVDRRDSEQLGFWSGAESYGNQLEQTVRGYPVWLFPYYELSRDWQQLSTAQGIPQDSRRALARMRQLDDCLGRVLADTLVRNTRVPTSER